MTDPLPGRVARDLAAAVAPQVAEVAAQLAGPGVRAVLFYGSILRTGDLSGVLDFYVLTDARPPLVWPVVGYREFGTLRAKIATMPLATFRRAATGATLDTTIWARFVQPAALAWHADDEAARAVAAAIADAVATASAFAAALGPDRGAADAYWRALFRATYAAEFRVEAGGREAQIVAHDPARYAELLPLGWARAAIGYAHHGDVLVLRLSAARRRSILGAWAKRRRAGRPINLARLVRAAFTFDGAAAYAAWKIERHTGVPVALKPWQHRHPILAAPGVLWRVWRAKR